MLKPPKWLDLIFLILLLLVLIFNPFFQNGQINTFETGLYLPGINSVLNGGVPFRDFLHLRGPAEIYMPALMMRIFGAHLNVLYLYFYLGNVFCIVLCVLIAKEIFKTRMIFYLFVPVLLGRTFPRVAYTFWGGMRFAWGLLAILLIVYLFKERKLLYSFLSGVIASLAVLTSIDVGICSLLSIITVFIINLILNKEDRGFIARSFLIFLLGSILLLLPYGIYLYLNNALKFFIESIYYIVFTLTKVMPDFVVEDQPQNYIQALLGLNPFSPYFKYLTPAYCYIFSLIYFALEFKKKRKAYNMEIMTIFFYGFILFVFSFRKIGTSAFEMALQPEKILLFFLVETAAMSMIRKGKYLFADIKARPQLIWRSLKGLRLFLIYFCMLGVICSSLGYTYMRFSRRFFTFRYFSDIVQGKDTDYLRPLNNEPSRVLRPERVRGIEVPVWQADDIEQVVEFINNNTEENEPVLMLPELGFYSFVVNRPFVGKFPMITFSWFGKGWFEEFMKELDEAKPKFAVVSKEEGPSFNDFYFRVKQNVNNYGQLSKYIDSNYQIVMQTPTLNIYRRKNGGS